MNDDVNSHRIGRSMPVGQSRLSALFAVSALLGGGYLPDEPRRSEPEERPCVNCGNPKRHNNSFCSAECCRDYRSR